MTKPRLPLTLADGVTRITGALGLAAAAEAVGKSESLVGKWSDPDGDKWPSPQQIVALEVAWRRAGGKGAPILEALAHEVERLSGSAPAPGDVMMEVLEAVGAAAGVAEVLRLAQVDGKIGAADWRRICEAAARAVEENLDVVRLARTELTARGAA